MVGRGDGGGEKMCWQTREVAVSSHQPATCPFRAGCVNFCKDFERLVRKARVREMWHSPSPAMSCYVTFSLSYRLLWYDARYGPSRRVYSSGDVGYDPLWPEIRFC